VLGARLKVGVPIMATSNVELEILTLPFIVTEELPLNCVEPLAYEIAPLIVE